MSTSFIGYLAVTLMTAVNDSMFRWMIVPVGQVIFQRQYGWSPETADTVVLSLGLGIFMLPFVVFAPWAGWAADRFSKRSSIIQTKIAEILLVILGVFAIRIASSALMLLVLFLLGAQAALIGTAKLGIIPEIVRRRDISAANGWSSGATLAGVILGTVAGYGLGDRCISTPVSGQLMSLAALGGSAILGLIGSLLIRQVAPASPNLRFHFNLFTDSLRDLQLIISRRSVFRVSLGIVFFWSVAAMAQMAIDVFVTDELAGDLERPDPGPFMAMLVIGVGLGSLLAGWWSSGRVELGMVPFGTVLMGLASMAMYFATDSPIASGTLLIVIGIGGGLFNIPLQAWLQERVPHDKLGTVLASCQQLTALGMLCVAGLFLYLREGLNMSASQIFLITGVSMIPLVFLVVAFLPQATFRFFVWLLSRFAYRVRTYGIENIPEQGPALLVANHVTWIDGILIALVSSRPIRMVAYADYVEGPISGRFARMFGIIPIRTTDGVRSLLKSLRTAGDALRNGELVCIFAEGAITRTGQLMKFERGMMHILKGTDAPVIPVCLDELWGSLFSYEGGRFFWKKPRNWPYPVSILFGSPMWNVEHESQVRDAVIDLQIQSMTLRKERTMIPALRFVRQCRLAWNRVASADSSGASLTSGKLLLAVMAFRRLLNRILHADTKHVAVLLPPSVGGVLANTSLAMCAKVSVNLNYTLSDELMNYCIREAGVKQVITSRAFLEKKPVELEAELIFLEDLKGQITGMDKALALLFARLLPVRTVARLCGLKQVAADDPLTVIFTSGSTGEPKGVMLSQNNIGSNLDAVNQLLQLHAADRILGVLPFFHSFGYTITMWLPLCNEPSAVYHFNPLDSRTVGSLVEQHGCTILAATPTFLRSYLKRCTAEQFATLNLVICGAEKMPDELRDNFREKFGFEPIEGYGTTEMSPVASFNVPASRMGAAADPNSGTRHGTVGRAIPGVAAAVFDPESGEPLGINKEGLLKIKGPNIMLGYINQPDKTRELIEDGWYNSGDMAVIDEDGFIRITGRMSRFSKIGGEMVPHILVEQHIASFIEDESSDDPQILCAVTSVPDGKKGERLIVLHRPISRTPGEITTHLQQAGLPNLFIPSNDSFIEVDSIPLLGTGKLDLRAVKQMALEKTGLS